MPLPNMIASSWFEPMIMGPGNRWPGLAASFHGCALSSTQSTVGDHGPPTQAKVEMIVSVRPVGSAVPSM